MGRRLRGHREFQAGISSITRRKTPWSFSDPAGLRELIEERRQAEPTLHLHRGGGRLATLRALTGRCLPPSGNSKVGEEASGRHAEKP